MDKKIAIRFVVYLVANIIIISLANSLFPGSFELGNASLSIVAAGVFSAFLLTTLLLVARGFARKYKITKRGRMFMFVYYWGATSASIWIIARIASVSGFGIARYTCAITLGFVTTLIHWSLRQTFKRARLIQVG